MTSSELRYLIAVSELYDGTAGVRLTAIAARMNVTKVSAFKAAERLEQEGCIMRDAKNKVVVTQHGYEQLKKYGMLIEWLSGHLEKNCKVPPETARHDAMGAVCAFSQESITALAEFINGKGEKHDR